MARKIVITSGKGGVGKTTITANLGLFLAKTGLRVLLVDLDLGLNNLDVVTGVENLIVFDLNDVIENKCRAKQSLIQTGLHPNLYVLPSNHTLAKNTFNAQNIKIVIDSLDLNFDYILLDCPAGIDIGFHRAISCANEALLVTTPNLSSLRDADKVLSILRSYKMLTTKIIVNRIRGDLVLNGNSFSEEDISDTLKTEIAGVIPEDDILYKGISYVNKCNSSKAFKLLANNIIKSENKIYNYTSKYCGFFGSIRRELKSKL